MLSPSQTILLGMASMEMATSASIESADDTEGVGGAGSTGGVSGSVDDVGSAIKVLDLGETAGTLPTLSLGTKQLQ